MPARLAGRVMRLQIPDALAGAADARLQPGLVGVLQHLGPRGLGGTLDSGSDCSCRAGATGSTLCLGRGGHDQWFLRPAGSFDGFHCRIVCMFRTDGAIGRNRRN